MSATPEQRAAWIAGMQTMLDLLRANPDLPVDAAGLRPTWPYLITLQGYSESTPQSLAAWESALTSAGIPFTPAFRAGGTADPDAANPDYYDLDASAGGLSFRVRFRLADVMERRVVDTRMVDVVEWVPLPVPDENPEGEAQS